MTLPFVGHPTGARKAAEAKCEEDKIESAYRFLLGDMMPFGKNALIRLEHGGQNESTEHYQMVTYWYGLNRPSLIKTDELKIGNAASEQAHHYLSPNASPPYEITSRYEWGVDTLNSKEIYPAHSDAGRKTSGTSEFNVKLNPKNLGFLLRRKLDYQYPNQRAEVFIAEVKQTGLAVDTPSPRGEGRGEGELQTSQNRHKRESHSLAGAFKPAGIWYLTGSSTCVYSNPKEELGAAQHNIQTSN